MALPKKHNEKEMVENDEDNGNYGALFLEDSLDAQLNQVGIIWPRIDLAHKNSSRFCSQLKLASFINELKRSSLLELNQEMFLSRDVTSKRRPEWRQRADTWPYGYSSRRTLDETKDSFLRKKFFLKIKKRLLAILSTRI